MSLDVVILNKINQLLFPDTNTVKAEPGTKLTTTRANGTVGAGSTTTVDIQPPVGETWLIHVGLFILGNGAAPTEGSVTAHVYDGANFYGGISNDTEVDTNINIGASGWFEVNNTQYLRMIFNNKESVGRAYGYQYFGWRTA